MLNYGAILLDNSLGKSWKLIFLSLLVDQTMCPDLFYSVSTEHKLICKRVKNPRMNADKSFANGHHHLICLISFSISFRKNFRLQGKLCVIWDESPVNYLQPWLLVRMEEVQCPVFATQKRNPVNLSSSPRFSRPTKIACFFSARFCQSPRKV